MKLLIIHDANGQILGLGEVHADPKQRRVGVVPHPGQSVIEVDKEPNFSHLKLDEVIQQYRVDTQAKRLVVKKK
jgi:hypothetical protein